MEENEVTEEIEAEAGYLKTLIDADRVRNGHDKRTYLFDNELAARRHMCSQACAARFRSMRYGERFTHEGTTRHASGTVFVCSESKKTHLCGTFCTQAVIMPNCAGSVCRLTGMDLARGESYAKNKGDIHMFRVGIHTVANNVPTLKTEGPTEGLMNKVLAEEASKLDVDFDHATEMFASSSSSPSFKVKKPKKTPPKKTPRVPPTIVASAAHVWSTYARNQTHIEYMESAMRVSTNEWFKAIAIYYNNCLQKKEPINILTIMQHFKRFVGPECRGLYYGIDIIRTNSMGSKYYIGCMVKIWGKYSEVIDSDRFKHLTFNSCATAILASLRTGLTIEVFFCSSNPTRPMIFGDMSMADQRTARSQKVVLVDTHPNLILAPPDFMRDTVRKKTKDVVLAFPVNASQSMPKSRGISRGSSIISSIPSVADRKPLNNLIELIVKSCKTMDDLMQFTFEVLVPREMTPSFVLRLPNQ